ncbi:Hydrogenase transcriptional regulatory protein HoxA [Bathymodiolus thermophilus thioautotrophic gill symbiont]|uniref:Hydrogenase transcriptional regulatory protein HoxA n=1 Tax=Bathymodiolus thermophilus thioautotrophic gill symbiont TaxID=2360 RepID=A0A3G3IPD4_9GAMM|nr:sigma-54 dependent transcriptional regulator [Bathymodiolus thermophilus thioautotrophic gill symbiont]AYQ57675.1 Hydrogenase transcriptional regulatory protein HoxA [Bathymodiolus thermophilus thioautotrophic gill symbiont]
MEKAHILVVDDEKRALETYHRTLKKQYEVHCAISAKDAWEILYEFPISVVLSDQKMPHTTGIEFLKQVKAKYPDIVRIIISAFSDSGDLILGINEAGIYQFLCKPWHPENLKLIIANAVNIYELQQQNQLLSLELSAELPRPSEAQLKKHIKNKQDAIAKKYAFDQLIRAEDSPLNQLCTEVQNFSTYDIPVLIYGESGTGKELFARAIHYYSSREEKPLIIENCAALPDDLLESELFGHVKGAFTGAYNDKKGLLEQANGGTIFLDEIGDISLSFQVKLLRALQEKIIRPLGGNRYVPIDIRVIAATNKNLKQEIKSGRFREDLFYRLAGVEFRVPPLRERKSDIILISMSIVKQGNLLFNKTVKGITDDAIALIENFSWRGNVRELQNEIQRAMVLAQTDYITADDLSAKLKEK